MSLRIIKAGIFDTVQDLGCEGSRHLGINPCGAMDRFSAQLVNALMGKPLDSALIETHYPASRFLFAQATLVCIGGGDLAATINEQPIPLFHPVFVPGGSILRFDLPRSGARSYIATLHHLDIEKWMGSSSTNLKAGAGGWHGRVLQKDDEIPFKEDAPSGIYFDQVHVLPWTAPVTIPSQNEAGFVIGSEWQWLEKSAQQAFQQHWFQITNEADRMGYRLKGPALFTSHRASLITSAVSFGTVQLLPSGQLIVLMADHQTTGGYPRIAHVISADLPVLAQKKPNDVIHFQMTDLATAESRLLGQQKYLNEIQIACKFRLENFSRDH